MPRTRSRQKTEEKFEQAVLELVAHEGCCALGVNAVAQRAGADKVLIYRYFGDLNGLLRRVAQSRTWLPSASETLQALSISAEDESGASVLQKIYRLLLHHIRADKTTHQLVRWRKADKNPLTDFFTDQWMRLWDELPDRLSTNLDATARQSWKNACGILALLVEAELCGEGLGVQSIDHLASTLVLGEIELEGSGTSAESEDSALPTNLL